MDDKTWRNHPDRIQIMVDEIKKEIDDLDEYLLEKYDKLYFLKGSIPVSNLDEIVELYKELYKQKNGG
jgi:hypothetical protein